MRVQGLILPSSQELDALTIKLKDLNFGIRAATHDPFKCYKASKIALTLFGKELARRTAETQVRFVDVMWPKSRAAASRRRLTAVQVCRR
jgi:NAD(P)-dependent dehydrogenase (short-subunit alcohol dehydrogenase family)